MFAHLVQLQRRLVVRVPAPVRGLPDLFVPLAYGQVVRVNDFGGGPDGYGLPVGGNEGVIPADAVEEMPESMHAWVQTAYSLN